MHGCGVVSFVYYSSNCNPLNKDPLWFCLARVYGCGLLFSLGRVACVWYTRCTLTITEFNGKVHVVHTLKLIALPAASLSLSLSLSLSRSLARSLSSVRQSW